MTVVSLITATGDRPRALDLCAEWMHRQTWDGGVEWIIVDDGQEPYVPEYRRVGWWVRHIKRKHTGPGLESFLGNVTAGVQSVTGDVVLFIEDDDWYAPEHIEEMVARLEKHEAVGNNLQRYYRLPKRSYLEKQNGANVACLCQTGLRAEHAPLILDSVAECRQRGRFHVDVGFWARVRDSGLRRDVYLERPTTVGMKGLPGRSGLGLGHQGAGFGPYRWKDDQGAVKLREWVGDDAGLYLAL